MSELVPVIERQFDAIARKRIDDIVGRYTSLDDAYVFLEGPRWSTIGHDRIATGWRAFVDAPLSLRSVRWVEGPYSATDGPLGWIAGIVDLDVEAGGQVKQVRLRGSFVMKREADGEWRIVHEHFSQPASDPYGIGDWLKS